MDMYQRLWMKSYICVNKKTQESCWKCSSFEWATCCMNQNMVENTTKMASIHLPSWVIYGAWLVHSWTNTKGCGFECSICINRKAQGCCWKCSQFGCYTISCVHWNLDKNKTKMGRKRFAHGHVPNVVNETLSLHE